MKQHRNKQVAIYFPFVALSSFLLVAAAQDYSSIPYILGLDDHCLRCLCYAATKCNLTVGCDKGYCGPYKISRIYWKDAGQVTLPEDNKERAGAYEDCAINYQCAQKIVSRYIIKYGRDCNQDGTSDCDDYSMINFNGGYQCRAPLDRSEPGKQWLDRYRACNPLPT